MSTGPGRLFFNKFALFLVKIHTHTKSHTPQSFSPHLALSNTPWMAGSIFITHILNIHMPTKQEKRRESTALLEGPLAILKMFSMLETLNYWNTTPTELRGWEAQNSTMMPKKKCASTGRRNKSQSQKKKPPVATSSCSPHNRVLLLRSTTKQNEKRGTSLCSICFTWSESWTVEEIKNFN